jgi:osmotically-inducible protein OsmY
MDTGTLPRTDVRLRNAVIRQLDWDPEVDGSAIGVSATDGVVTLTGFIDTFAGKLAAERTTKRVRGVRAIANDLVVRPMVDRTDADIARDAAQALRLLSGLDHGIQAAVHQGHVSLTGAADWSYQKRRAEKAVRHIRGVLGVRNYITVRSQAAERDARRRIVGALHDLADLDVRGILVTVADDKVILTGRVRSIAQRDAAERAAAAAPGIAVVDNRLSVEPEPPHVEPPDELC